MKTTAKVTRLLLCRPKLTTPRCGTFVRRTTGANCLTSLILSSDDFELAHQFESFVALLDFVDRQLAQTFQAECFHRETGEHASINHRFAQISEMHSLHCSGQISRDAAGEGVPCPGWIVNVFQRIGAAAEKFIIAEK